MSKRIYLAGPEVFLLHAREIGARKRAVCEAHGLVGVFPTDKDACDPALPLPERGLAISRAIERAMQGCDAMIVNLTPFRGPSTDVGSAYELGFMRALGRPIVGYTNDNRAFLDRVAAFCGGTLRQRATGEHEDIDGMAIEAFELHDNLMLAGGIIASGGCIIADAASHAERYTSFAAFERCVTHARVSAMATPPAKRRQAPVERKGRSAHIDQCKRAADGTCHGAVISQECSRRCHRAGWGWPFRGPPSSP